MALDKDTLAVLDLLVEKINGIQAGGGGITAAQLETILQNSAATHKTTVDALQNALIPENKVHPGISAYSYPEGDRARPKPTLKHEVLFCGYRQRDDNLTPEEIDALNAIDGDREARNGTWRAYLRKEGMRQILIVECDEMADRDRARDLPPMLHILLELGGGVRTLDPVVLLKQINALKAQMEAAGIAA